MIRLLATAFLVFALTVAAYAASPLLAAWQIRDAVQSGDVATLRARVDWAQVRTSLRQSLAVEAKLKPAVALSAAHAGAPPPAPRGGLWLSLKSAVGYRILDHFLATYVSPEGFIKLHKLRTSERRAGRVKGALPPPPKAATDDDGTFSFLARIKEATFLSPTRFRLTVSDRDQPARLYVARFDLVSTTWTLTGLSIGSVQPPAAATEIAGAS